MNFRVHSLFLWLTREFKKLDISCFSPGKDVYAAIKEFVFWVSIAFVLILLAGIEALPGHEYLSESESEGVGPHLWNVLGTFGVLFLGVMLLMPSARIAWLANMVFKNVYSLGCLSFGLLFGMWVFKLDLAYLNVWQDWALQIWFVSVFFTIFVINLLVWYLSWLTDKRERPAVVLMSLSQIDIRLRILVSLVLVVLVLTPLYWQK